MQEKYEAYVPAACLQPESLRLMIANNKANTMRMKALENSLSLMENEFEKYKTHIRVSPFKLLFIKIKEFVVKCCRAIFKRKPKN